MAWITRMPSGHDQVDRRDPDERRRSRTPAKDKDARTDKARIETELDSTPTGREPCGPTGRRPGADAGDAALEAIARSRQAGRG